MLLAVLVDVENGHEAVGGRVGIVVGAVHVVWSHERAANLGQGVLEDEADGAVGLLLGEVGIDIEAAKTAVKVGCGHAQLLCTDDVVAVVACGAPEQVNLLVGIGGDDVFEVGVGIPLVGNAVEVVAAEGHNAVVRALLRTGADLLHGDARCGVGDDIGRFGRVGCVCKEADVATCRAACGGVALVVEGAFCKFVGPGLGVAHIGISPLRLCCIVDDLLIIHVQGEVVGHGILGAVVCIGLALGVVGKDAKAIVVLLQFLCVDGSVCAGTGVGAVAHVGAEVDDVSFVLDCRMDSVGTEGGVAGAGCKEQGCRDDE